MSAEQFQARPMGVECTASAEPESHDTPRRCLRVMRLRLEVCRGLCEQRRCLERRDACSREYDLAHSVCMKPECLWHSPDLAQPSHSMLLFVVAQALRAGGEAGRGQRERIMYVSAL